MMIKYPVHKLAKDFKKGGKVLPSKEVMDILAQYGHPPKNHMQPLTDLELSIVFEYLTQHNQVESLESVFAAAPKAKEGKSESKGENKGKAEAKSEELFIEEFVSSARSNAAASA